MNLSKTSQYALRIMNYMVLHGDNTVTAKHLHEKLKISYPYIRKLLTILSGKKLIKGGKGRVGGYVLANKPGKIFLEDILKAAGEPVIFDACLFGFGDCVLTERCLMHNRWSEARENIVDILQTTSLEDLKPGKTKIKSVINKTNKK
ncbi:MAG: Rrf2 family transcriptional regulator [Ignavibacteria bacterium]|nr:Rrf2 family transcriptional regulator [Ignavibacteria bacterium]